MPLSTEQIRVEWHAPDGQVYQLTTPGGKVRAQAANLLGQAAPVTVTVDSSPRGGGVVRHVQYGPRYLILPILVRGTSHQDFVERWERIGDAFLQTSQYNAPGKLRVQRPDGSARYIEAWYVSGWEGRPELGWDVDYADALTLVAPRPWWRAPVPPIRREFDAEGGPDFFDPFLSVGSDTLLGATTVSNPGRVKAWPLWTVTGPLDELTATNHRTGETFALNPDWDGGGSLGEGETVTIQTDPVKVRGPAGQIWTGAITGTLWGLDRGLSNVEFTATGGAAGTAVELTFDALYETA